MNHKGSVQPVDEVLPAGKLTLLGIQHVLVMYAGAVAVPLIIGGAMKLPKEQLAMLINADLFACGLVTLIQSLGIWRFGVRLPVMMGVTFAAVSPMIVMATTPDIRPAGHLRGGDHRRRVRHPGGAGHQPHAPGLPAGGHRQHHHGHRHLPHAHRHHLGRRRQQPDHHEQQRAPVPIPNPAYGAPLHLAVAAIVLVFILLVTKYVKGFFSNIAVLLGLVLGMLIAIALGKVNFGNLGLQPWFAFVRPFQFGLPTFNFGAALTMCLVMVVVMIESLGMFLAVGEIVGKPMTQRDIANGLRVDGLGTVIGGVFNTFPYTSFSQNVGLVGVTGVRSRYVCVTGGIILVLLGLLPKLAFIVASVPLFVLGGAGIVMFGMVAATGIRILSGVDFQKNRHNLYIVAISIGFGMIPLVADKFFAQMPRFLGPLLGSGILLASIIAVVLNLFFNRLSGHAAAASESKGASMASEA